MNSNIDWNEIRKKFPATEKYYYLNAAEGSPIASSTAEAAKRFYDEMLEDGDLPYEEWLNQAEEVRAKLALFINASSEELAFTSNTSSGMNIIAEILKDTGDLVTMEHEFPSSSIPWLHKNFNLKFVKSTDNKFSIEAIDKEVDANTKFIVSSYVQYCTGFKQNLIKLGEYCKEKNIIFIINATQALGAMPIDVKAFQADFLVFTSLKWASAGYGIGASYINKELLENKSFKLNKPIKLPLAGWQSVKDPDAMNNQSTDFKTSASMLEPGCLHFPNIFALGAAIDLFNSIGKENIEQRIYELGDYLVSQLQKLDLKIISPLEKEHRSGISIVKLNNAQRVVEKLRQKNIIISARGEGIRISTHIYNNKEDIGQLVAALQTRAI